MAHLLNRLILYVICMALLFVQHFERNYVVLALCCLIVELFESYYTKQRAFEIHTGLYCVLILFIPELAYILPLRVYGFVRWKRYLGCFILLELLFVMSYVNAFLILLLAILSMLLAFYTQRQIEINQHFLLFRDTRKEEETRLLEQNKILLEKQDYEIYTATLHERNRIAREIHDHVGHQLSSSILQVAALQTIEKDERLRTHLGVLKTTLDQAMNDIRSSVHGLHDESIDLEASVQGLLNNFTFCAWSFDYDVQCNLHRTIKFGFTAIIKEALSNVSRHSNATQITIRIIEHPALIQLCIDDNGTMQKHIGDEGMGLSNMRERVEQLHGHIQIRNRDGFHIFVSVEKESDV